MKTALNRKSLFVFFILLFFFGLIFLFIFKSLSGHLLWNSKDPKKLNASNDAVLIITDPSVLSNLETLGASLGHQLGGQLGASENNRTLLKLPFYRSVVEKVREDLLEQRGSLTNAPNLADRYARLFDFDWLISSRAHFELIGFVNRFDRILFSESKGDENCGEARLIYRLAYSTTIGGEALASRLPMTLALIYMFPRSADDPYCKNTARSSAIQSDDILKTITSAQSIYRPIITRLSPFKLLEINVQISRWPAFSGSTFAEQAHYLLRAFERNAKTNLLEVTTLENTPDVEYLRRDETQKKKLLKFLRVPESLAAIERGNLKIPNEFLAQKATSVAPFGLNRFANRPFSQLFTEADFKGIKANLIDKSLAHPSAFLRRLDSLSCVGCHQSRSVAGFHLLGQERDETTTFNAITLPFSPYVEATLPWREILLDNKIHDQRLPNLPSTERGIGDFAGYGARCGRIGSAFQNWRCQEGLRCYTDFPLSEQNVGQCFPNQLGNVGDPCETSQLKTTAISIHDQILENKILSCGKFGTCSRRTSGFPSGMCITSCDLGTDNTICDKVTVLNPFSECLTKHLSFRTCLNLNSQDAALRRCGLGLPCRDDYVCAKSSKSVGICVPTYFVPQLTVENHPALPL